MTHANDPNQANTTMTALLLQLLPADHSAVGTGALLNQFGAACQAAGLGPVTADDFQAAREALVATGQDVKGRGRGGATARATGADRPAFALQAQAVPLVPATSTPAPSANSATTTRIKTAPPQPTASDPAQAKTTYAYDPHLDPVREPAPARGGGLLKHDRGWANR